MDAKALDLALRSPDAYAHEASSVEVIETHLSRLYFVGARVYKVKKAVDLGFVDFTTLAKRKFACDEEVRLNRRLAPDTYLGVVPIVAAERTRERAASPASVRVGGSGEPIEYAVEMERLPAAHMLDAQLERGEIDSQRIEQIVARLASFHAAAQRGPEIDRFAEPESIARRVLGNLDRGIAAARELEVALATPRGGALGATAACLPPALAAFLRGAFERFLREGRPRFEQRIRDGRICEGHGDLHAGNLCILPDRPARAEPVVAFDCIEFSRELRCLDVAADLAFLLMDLDRRQFRAFARDLVRRYAQRAADPGLEAMLAFYKAHLACVRGTVAALRGAGSDDAAVRSQSRLEATSFFVFAASYALPPFLVATCGLPGSGKSFVAHALAPALDALHYQSDFERKKLARVTPTAPTPAARRSMIYSTAMTERTYGRLLGVASRELALGRRVILDATFTRASQRARAATLARELGVPFVLLHCQADDVETRRRLALRAGERGQYSDADAAVYEQVKARFEPPEEIPAAQRVDVHAGAAAPEVAAELLERVIAQLEAAGRLPLTFPTG